MPKKKLSALVILGIIGVVLLILLLRLRPLVDQVQEEMRTTPTPTPLTGNIAVVTQDPSVTKAPAAPVLKKGSQGEEVLRLQQRLAQLGYYTGVQDGQFGNGTYTAVLLFQGQNGLEADGMAGTATLTLLYSEEAIPCVTPTPAPSPTPEPTHTPQPTAVPSQAKEKQYFRVDGLPLLISAACPLPDDYEAYDLVCMNDYCDPDVVIIKYDDTWAEREAVDALMVMLQAAQAQGIKTWQISSAYRSVEYQQRLLDNKIAEYRRQGYSAAKARTAALRYVNEPGTSEHQTGVCFDITVPGKSFTGTKQSTWLAEHAWEYGFIQRYPGKKASITGINNESWHYRYVGIEHAAIMHEENLCLQEYIEAYGLIIE